MAMSRVALIIVVLLGLFVFRGRPTAITGWVRCPGNQGFYNCIPFGNQCLTLMGVSKPTEVVTWQCVAGRSIKWNTIPITTQIKDRNGQTCGKYCMKIYMYVDCSI